MFVRRMSHFSAGSRSEDAGSPTRIRIVASDALVHDALGRVLAQLEGIEIVRDRAQDEREAAHVVLWDGGAEYIPAHRAQLQALVADSRAPALALALDDVHAAVLLGAGARGAVLREASAPRLAAAAVAVRHGLYVVDTALAGPALGPWNALAAHPPEPELGEPGLTAREREVLALLGLGLSNKAIARRLEVSVHTVKFHVNSILVKLNADSRTAAVTAAVRRGLLSL